MVGVHSIGRLVLSHVAMGISMGKDHATAQVQVMEVDIVKEVVQHIGTAVEMLVFIHRHLQAQCHPRLYRQVCILFLHPRLNAPTPFTPEISG